jgi:hypothetical protein
MEKDNKMAQLIKTLKNNGFTGYVRISYDLGGISKIEKNEEILKKMK